MRTIWLDLVAVPFRQTYRKVGGHRIRCIEAGEGPPLILLHSGGGYAESYARNIAAHARRFHVYVPDQVGYGFSDRPEGSYALTTMAARLGEFQDSIGAEQVYLSGLSVGGWIAALHAGAHPDRVKRLVLNSGVPLRPDAKGIKEFNERSAGDRGPMSEADLRANARRTLQKLLTADDNGDELAEVAYRLAWHVDKAHGTRHIIETQLSEMIDDTETSRQTGPDALRSIACPTLIMWPHKNPGQSLDLAQDAVRLIRDARLHVFKRAGHWPQWEEPEEYNRVQIEFFSAEP